MKLELFQIVDIYNSFAEIKKSNEMPFALAWQISDTLEPLKKHIERFNEERNKLIKQYGKEDKENNQFLVEAEKITEFTEKLNQVGKTEIELKGIKKIKKDELFNSNIKINGAVNIEAIKVFIV